MMMIDDERFSAMRLFLASFVTQGSALSHSHEKWFTDANLKEWIVA